MLSKETLLTNFHKLPRLLFITVRGPDRWQKIGKVNDFIRRKSSNYFIVREKDKRKDGYHFHALVSQEKDIKPNWFRKGIHVHIKPVVSGKTPHIPECAVEADILKYGTPDPPVGVERVIHDTLYSIARTKRTNHAQTVKNTKLLAILNYMFKEVTDNHQLYQDYIIKLSPKSKGHPGCTPKVGAALPTGASAAIHEGGITEGVTAPVQIILPN